MGEKNNHGIKNVLRTSLKAVLGIGIAFNLFFFFFAKYIPALYGMVSPEIIEASVQACRSMSFTAIPFGFAYFFYWLYPLLGKGNLCFLLALRLNFVCPLAAAIPMTYAFGITGLSVGMSLSSFLVIIIFGVIICTKYGKEGFPFYLEDYGEEVVAFDLIVTEEMITVIRDKVEAEFEKQGYKIRLLPLLIEELYSRILDKNPGKKIISECTLFFGQDHARIIVRDNGTVFNFVDENNKIESLNAYVLNCLLSNINNKKYIMTTSFNRNEFLFEKQIDAR